MNVNEHEARADIMNRLKKIEGQVKGIQKMVDEEKCCNDVMVQISAVRSAINRVGGLIMDKYVKECLKKSLMESKSESEINELIETVVKYIK